MKNKHQKPLPEKTADNGSKYQATVGWVLRLIQKEWPFLAIIGGLVLVTYINAINAGLVSDDKGLNNPANLANPFADPFAFLRILQYSITNTICGPAPFCYRLQTILFHLGNAWLIFIVISLMARRPVAFFTATLFAIHPLLTEAVVWISAGAYVQYTFFFLLSLLFYIFAKKDSRWYWASLGVLIIAMFTTNRLMALPIFFAYELILGDIRKYWARLIPIAVLIGVWGLAHLIQINPREVAVVGEGNVNEWTYNPLFAAPFSISSYFNLFVWPDKLSFYHSNIQTTTVEMVIRWIILLGYFGLTVFSFFKNKVLCFWLVFFFIGLLLYLTPFKIAWLVAERYVYLSSIGIFFLLGYLFTKLTQIGKLKIAVFILFALVITSLTARTMVRNYDWRDEDALMVSTLRTNPENARVHNHVGIIHGKNKDYQNAIREFEIAIKLDEYLAEPYHNLANAYQELGEIDKAIPLYEKALSLDEKHWLSYFNLANIYRNKEDKYKSAGYLEKAVQYQAHPQLFSNLGITYLEIGERQKAVEAFKKALALDPNLAIAQQGLQEAQADPGQIPAQVLSELQKKQQTTTSIPQASTLPVLGSNPNR